MIQFDWNWFWGLFLYNEDTPLLFHTGFFLFIFSLFLVLYSLLQRKDNLRSVFLISFGFYFYYKASGYYMILLVSTISVDYFFARLLVRTKHKSWRYLQVISSIVFSLSFLLYFKYKNFFLENVNGLLGSSYSLSSLILPIGISFYTFQSISFIVDIYSKRIELPSFKNYLLYMTFFPHLVAGPIVRASDFLPQLKGYIQITVGNIKTAAFLILKGFVKKAIIGDFVAQYSDLIFEDPNLYSSTEQLIGVLSYTLQIFCDFSGYTDMAIGVALLLGYKLCANFDSPYKSLNITEFWRKWHISLSSWLRDYIYIPLGGNRRGAILQYSFLLITMLLGGFWHGANWKFVFWGAGHGGLLILHKLLKKSFSNHLFINSKPFKLASWFITFSVVCLLWVPFRAQSIEDTYVIYAGLFKGFDFNLLMALAQNNFQLIVFLILGFSLTMLNDKLKGNIRNWFERQDFIVITVLFVILIQIMLQFQSSSVEPFIYFQF
jgi:alginate O-acetyltransferase complex protein AlgI